MGKLKKNRALFLIARQRQRLMEGEPSASLPLPPHPPPPQGQTLLISVGNQEEGTAPPFPLDWNPDFTESVKNVPRVDISALKEEGCALPDVTIAKIIATHKWTEKMCNHCGRRGEKLFKCAYCKLELYCNGECQKLDWKNEHKNRCCKPDGPRDNGPRCLGLQKTDANE